MIKKSIFEILKIMQTNLKINQSFKITYQGLKLKK